MKMHILIGKSVCKLDYFEAAVGGKNALDHQISTWLGYLIGTGAAERNYYIVSRDMGYKFVASFWSENEKDVRVRVVDSIKAAGRMERNRQMQRENALKAAQEAAQQEAEPVSAEETAPVESLPVEEPVPPVEQTVAAEAASVEEAMPAEEPAPVEDPVQPEEPAEEEKEPAENQQSRSRNRRNRHSRGRRRGDSQTSDTKPEAKQEPAEEPKQEEVSKTEEKPKVAQSVRSKKEEGIDLSGLLAPYPMLQEEHLKTLIAEKKKQILCNTLRKQLGQEKGLALYNEIKRAAWR